MRKRNEVLRDHQISFSYNLPKLGEINASQQAPARSQQPYVNPLLLSQEKSGNLDKAMDSLLKTSQEATRLLVSQTGELNIQVIRKFLNEVRDNIGYSMNEIDTERVNGTLNSSVSF